MKNKLLSGFQLLVLSAVFICGCLGCATNSGSGKAGASAENNPLKNNSALVSGVLENGLSYYILRNSYPENRLYMRLIVKIGSAAEAGNERGLAHFVEHMAFNGSTHFTENELIDYFESIGMSFGPEVNAHTSYDETVYRLEIPADDPEILAKSLTVISDWACGLDFDSEEVEKERGVVLEEWRLNRGVDGRTFDELLPFLFPFSRYANRPPVGEPRVIQNAPGERIAAFYKKWYRPELMSLVIAGDMDSAMLEQAVRNTLSAIPPSEKKITRPAYRTRDSKLKLSLLFSDPEAPVTQVFMGRIFPPARLQTEGDYRLFLARELANAILGARLNELAEDSDYLLDADFYEMEVVRPLGFTWFRPDNGVFAEAFGSILDETDRFARFGVTEEELVRAKAALKSRALTNWQNRGKTESETLIYEMTESVLKDTPFISADEKFRLALDAVDTLGADEVNAVIARYHSGRGTRLLTITSPDAGVPSKRTVERLWKSSRDEPLVPYRDLLDGRSLFGRPLSSAESEEALGEIVNERILAAGAESAPPVIELTLSNGAKVVVCQTDFRKDRFVFAAGSRGGLSLVSDEQYPSAAYSDYYAARSG